MSYGEEDVKAAQKSLRSEYARGAIRLTAYPVSGLVAVEANNDDEPALMWQEFLDFADELRRLRPERLRGERDLEALPVGSVVRAHWPDGSQDDYQVTRGRDGSGSSTGGFGVLSGEHWLGMAWWPGVELTLLYRAEGA